MNLCHRSFTVTGLVTFMAVSVSTFVTPQHVSRFGSCRGKASELSKKLIEKQQVFWPELSSTNGDDTAIPTSRNQLTSDQALLDTSCCGMTAPLAPSLDHIDTSLLPASSETDNAVYVFPLVVSPKNYTENFCLRGFMRANRDWVDEQILKYGAVLFRGFDIDSAAEVEADVRALEPNLSNEYRGTSPRNTQEGSDFVFSAAEVPSHFPIAQHLEMSFLPAPPRRLFFSALQAPHATPGKKGGETALTDFRKVYRDLPPKLREKLATKKIRYTRKHKEYGFKPEFMTTDITSLKGWSDLFDTHDQTLVEEICRAEDTPMRWEGGKDKKLFVSEYNSEPFQYHPDTKEPVYFNHAQVFHWSTFPAELFHAFRRTKDIRFLLRSISTGLVSFVTYGLLRRRVSLHVSYGDGSPISVREMGQIRKAIHKNMVFNQWKTGDLLLIDNFSTSHGREPTYSKNRKIVVAWSQALAKSNDPVYGGSTA
ncbi:Taurine catabolism dioxygenase TauD, TfdA family [Seminavis robusta]|uniref:Taurine catabolism dioxygenase TauD, TfdA family n=1 Tax=Seminavis robusta TaxID=568900 RepID=A0A9N8HP47_9STRA|nr:Taurine catabolism dioxygenase TauD, TfdA family [Seminavis robusta]|eukprot:Sro1037_g234120.1 Taurine catabolism dioxygenase TauD, TfdA family (481) ;mRNA; f:13109-14624